jgi:hypothetical protein
MCDEMKNCCGCFGPQGPQGIPGFQGPQGPQGPSGQDGKSGPAGPMGPTGSQGIPGLDGQSGPLGAQGPIGPMGPQGVQGVQGIPGKDCDCTQKKCEIYCNIYALPPQLLGAFGSATDTVVFQSQNAVSSGDFDLSNINTTGEVKFLKSAIYSIRWGAEAKVEPPIPLPVPSFSFGLWVNGVVIPGSVQSGYTQAPGDDTLPISSAVMIQLNAGDVLKLRNAAAFAVNMDPNTVGIVFPVTVASLNIQCLKSLP